MKTLAGVAWLVALSTMVCSAQDFYPGDVKQYDQSGSSGTGSRQGRYVSTMYEGVGPREGEYTLSITKTEVRLILGRQRVPLAQSQQADLLAGNIVTLPSGGKIQLFKSAEDPKRCELVFYSGNGLLVQILFLVSVDFKNHQYQAPH